MKENSREDRVNILKIECYITINDEKEPILNIGTSFSNMIESEEFKYYNDKLHKNIKPVLNDLKQMLLSTLENRGRMKNSIEEYIKILEKFSNENVIYGSTVSMTLEKYKDLQLSAEHILSDYKRVLKENEELNEKILDNAGIYQLGFKDGEKSYIKKVKDKIEEEKLPLVIVGGRRNKRTLEYGIKLGRRQALQELLGSEE